MNDRTEPDVQGRDLPTVSNPDPCGGGDLPGVRFNDELQFRDRLRRAGATHAADTRPLRAEGHPTPGPSKTLAEQARTLVDGARQSSYGEPVSHMRRIAAAWSAVLHRPFTGEEVALALTALKLVREGNQPGRDNRVDACGYLDILDRCYEDVPHER